MDFNSIISKESIVVLEIYDQSIDTDSFRWRRLKQTFYLTTSKQKIDRISTKVESWK